MKTFILAFVALYLVTVLALFLKFRMKALNFLFIFSFMLVITLPLLFTDTRSAYSALENRTLAAKPRLASGVSLFRQTDDYLNDRFGFKNYFVRVNNVINRSILHEAQNNRVLFGRNNWLFYVDKTDGDNLSDFQKTNLFDDESIALFAAQIERRAKWCEDNGIRFVFIIAPNKHNIYPEQYPMERPAGLTRTDGLLQYLPPALKDKVIFPRDALLARKQSDGTLLYYETDTHWNKLGAYYCFEMLFEKIKAYFPGTVFPAIEYRVTVGERGGGDLVPMLGLKAYGTTTEVDIEPVAGWSAYYSYIKNDDKNGVITENIDRNLPRAVIFRDSFFTALELFTSCVFSRAEYIWHHFTSNDKAHILADKPDIIIWEVVERNIASVLRDKW